MRSSRILLWRLIRYVAVGGLAAFATYMGFCVACLLLYTFVNPPTTGVQIQRRVASWFEEASYQKRYYPVSGKALPDYLGQAAIASEDGRFYEHWGVDWEAVQQALEDNKRRGTAWRGGSTITQQLVKNLFMTTHRSYVRKALELPLAYAAELILSKERILTLYVNVIEWDRGVYGAEAAARHHYNRSASELTRYQAASLVACIPAPRRRTPQRMGRRANTILRRMSQMGW